MPETIINLLLVICGGLGGYRFRRFTDMNIWGLLAAEFFAFAFSLVIISPLFNEKRFFAVWIALLIGTLLAEVLTKSAKKKTPRT